MSTLPARLSFFSSLRRSFRAAALSPRLHQEIQDPARCVGKIVELVGSSKDSIEDAIQTAIKRADATLRNLRWFEVIQTRGHVENGEVSHYQVVLKAGFTLEGGDQ